MNKFTELTNKQIEENIYICPSCGRVVQVQDISNQYEDIDENHAEGYCPFCHRFCCFLCEYVYT